MLYFGILHSPPHLKTEADTSYVKGSILRMLTELVTASTLKVCSPIVKYMFNGNEIHFVATHVCAFGQNYSVTLGDEC